MRTKVQLRRTAGFSLIELLIVVAIIAALVGVAVPMFQKNIQEAHRAKAQQDLDTIRNAITLHDSQNKPLVGKDLKPLLGRYLQELPKDPWGNDYLLDAGMGLLISFGGDQKAGGTDEDEDLRIRYKSVLKIQKVVYTGAWGLPSQDALLRITFNKPYTGGGAPALADLVLVLNNKSNATIPFSGGSVTADPATSTPIAATDSSLTWGSAVWSWDNSSDPNSGLAVLKVTSAGTPGPNTIRLNPSYAVNIRRAVASGAVTTDTNEVISTCVIREKFTPEGPCDPATYGSGVLQANGAHPQELIGGENRGVAIERTR